MAEIQYILSSEATKLEMFPSTSMMFSKTNAKLISGRLDTHNGFPKYSCIIF